MNVLLMCSRTRTDKVYGAGAWAAVSAALDEYAAARRAVGRTLRLVADDAENMAFWGFQPLTNIQSRPLAAGVRLAREKERVDALLIVGGPEIVPHDEPTNPISGTGDAVIPSDNIYGCPRNTAEWLPELPVGRLVGESTGGAESLIAHIRTMTTYHRARPVRTGACAVGCAVWAAATRKVVDTIAAGSPVKLAPSFVAGPTTTAALGVRRLYFNLHGFDDSPPWQGQDGGGLVPSITPDTLASASLTGAVIFAANCYGAHLRGKTARTSSALRAVANGAMSFIGATTLSYGAGSHSTNDVLFADRLAQLFFERHTHGVPAGQALVSARLVYAAQNSVGQALPNREYKTAMQFILLGDPTL